MTLKHIDEYRDAEISQNLIQKIKSISQKEVRLMEVCGTHTVSIFRSGIRSVLPPTISLLSGPGCPVCVTDQAEIDAFIELARIDDVIVTTFGDLMRVPGTRSSLQKESAAGRDIRVVYSTFDAVEIAKKNPAKKVVFLGVGFETTAPTIAAAILSAAQAGVENFSVISAHKLVPPALEALMAAADVNIDGFILPGHVSVIIGLDAYRPFFDRYQIPCVVAGFEPTDILQAISVLVEMLESKRPALDNAYPRAVSAEGNTKAQQILTEIFEPVDACWRGIGMIPLSGLKIRQKYADHDAQQIFDVQVPDAKTPHGCACGEILIGTKIPPECALYKKACTPMDPVGPCMVSTEGTCAAYYKYHSD
ncbi:MAG: hydrogenase formation protein HypD [Desulfobacterales bacterium]|nr:hydrogenase formation protein HypD [Desulfobacterales bacterium]MDJ0988143.1 hydrogenase formation protein HypD [Desulfobacterales bacterium]